MIDLDASKYIVAAKDTDSGDYDIFIEDHPVGSICIRPLLPKEVWGYEFKFFDGAGSPLSVTHYVKNGALYFGTTIPNLVKRIGFSQPLEKPPLGLRPRMIVEEQRCSEIEQAVERYRDANKEVPHQWLEELAERKAWISEHKDERL